MLCSLVYWIQYRDFTVFCDHHALRPNTFYQITILIPTEIPNFLYTFNITLTVTK